MGDVTGFRYQFNERLKSADIESASIEELSSMILDLEVTVIDIKSQLQEYKDESEENDKKWFRSALFNLRMNNKLLDVYRGELYKKKVSEKEAQKDKRSLQHNFMRCAKCILDKDTYQEVIDMARSNEN